MSKLGSNRYKPSHEEIAKCARVIYEMEGRPEGRAMDHWLLAESLLIEEAQGKTRHEPVRNGKFNIASSQADIRNSTQLSARVSAHK